MTLPAARPSVWLLVTVICRPGWKPSFGVAGLSATIPPRRSPWRACLISAAQLAWEVYRDLKKETASLSSEVIARKVRLQVAVPAGIDDAQRDRVVATVVDEVTKGAG